MTAEVYAILEMRLHKVEKRIAAPEERPPIASAGETKVPVNEAAAGFTGAGNMPIG